MLRSLCQLQARSRVVTSALGSAVQSGPLQGYRGHSRVNAILPSQNVLCQYSVGVRQMSLLSLNGASGFQGAVNTKLGLLPILSNMLPNALPSAAAVPSRSLTKWSVKKGKRKTVKAILKRFKRLHWQSRGIWIRPRSSAKKRMWKKSPAQRRRCKSHVFCNATQSYMLDKMVTRYWRKMRHYPDDPYTPYMKRENFSKMNSYPREFY